MKRILFGVAVLVGSLAFAGSSAEASSRRGHHGHGHHGHGHVHGGRSFHGHHHVHRPIYNTWGYTQPYWHDTSHYHYYPTRIVPHGDHYDVIPGHYHLHRSGHWHH